MNRLIHANIVVLLTVGLAACSNDPSTASASDSFQPRAEATPDKVAPKLQPKITVPAGTTLRVVLIDAVSSDKSRAGDQFMASLMEPVIVDGKTVLAKGTKVRGRVMDAKASGRVKGRASLELTLTQILRDKEAIPISTRPYTAVAEATKKRDAAVVGGGAGLGAAIGAIAGGGKGAAIGAAVGGGAGTGTVLATKGKEVRFSPEHPLSFTLAASIEI